MLSSSRSRQMVAAQGPPLVRIGSPNDGEGFGVVGGDNDDHDQQQRRRSAANRVQHAFR